MLRLAQTSIACKRLGGLLSLWMKAWPTSLSMPLWPGREIPLDMVRVVTDIALLLCPSSSMLDLDETTFWRHEQFRTGDGPALSTDAIIALTKFFVLEWSVEFDCQMYHDLPPQLMMK